MLENFIYSKKKSSFESALNNEEVLDGAIAFIEDTKQIWTRGTYFDCSAIDPTIIDSVNQFLEHKEHFPKIKATTTIPNDNILPDEFQIYKLEKDIEITNPNLFNTLDKLIEGDLYLRGKIDTVSESVPTSENPCMSGLVNGAKINIVFKNGEYDLGVNEDGYVRTTLRTVEPVWEVVASGSNFKLKHINSGQWLFYGDNSLYELSPTEATEFNTKVKNSSERLYELQRVGASWCINMSKGSGLNYNIGEYTSGDQNNALYIINSSKYKLPNLSTESVYTIRFTSSSSYGYRINGSNVTVGNSYSKLSLVGTYNKLALFFNGSYLYLNDSNILVTSSTEKTYFRLIPKSIQSNRDFEFVIVGNETKALNAFQGIANGNNISIWNKGDSNNSICFTKVGESGVLINRIITNKPATALRDGLMSSEDKQTLNQLYYSNKRNLIDIDKSTRSDKITLLGKYQSSNEWQDLVELNVATTSASGLLSATDKTKLDSFQAANTYATKEQVNSINQVSWSILKPEVVTTESNPELQAALYSAGLVDNENYSMKEELAAITNEQFNTIDKKSLITFNEFKHFTNVTSIGASTFDGCSSLTSITIPESVTSIGDYAFRGCSSLTAVHISSIEAWCKISFNVNYSNPLYYAHNLYLNGELVTELVIPEGVTSIGDGAFYGCSRLASINIPESVTSIGMFAFSDCSSLTSITLPASVTSVGEYAFYKCSSLASVTIPENSQLTSIGNRAFEYCSSLTSINIPNGVTSLEDCILYGCSSLTSINISESVTSIGLRVLGNCSSLTTITVNEGNSMYDSRNECNAVIKTSDNTLILGCVSTIIPESVTSIGSEAFYGCTDLTSINIPENVTSIAGSAFVGCRNLTTITIPSSMTSIGSWTFNGCSGLTSITSKAVTPPSVSSNTFTTVDKSAQVYVPAESVDVYKAADYWKNFTNIQAISE